MAIIRFFLNFIFLCPFIVLTCVMLFPMATCELSPVRIFVSRGGAESRRGGGASKPSSTFGVVLSTWAILINSFNVGSRSPFSYLAYTG